MKLTLISKNVLYKISLPKVIQGNYWLTDQNEKREKKLINVEGIDGKWQLITNENINIIDLKYIEVEEKSGEIKVYQSKELKPRRVILEENQMYGITFNDSKNFFILCCLPSFEKDFIKLNIKQKEEYFIGKDSKNQISYRCKLLSEVHAKIYFYNNCWNIENYDLSFGTFVNEKPVIKNQVLFNGDIIFIMGLKIVIMGDSIFINNPQENLYYSGDMFEISNRKIEKPNLSEDSEIIEDLYEEDEYFSRAPRITNIIEREKVKIDSPPQPQDKEEMPLILTLGSSMSMGTIMLVSLYNAIDGAISGTANIKQTITAILIAVIMIISIVLFPILTSRYNKRKKQKYELKRQTRYKEYLMKKKDYINKIISKQKEILYENNLSPEQCVQVIENKSGRLWERKIEDYDFLNIRLGIGDIKADIEIQYPEERFTMEDDNLIDILNDIANSSKYIKAAPITISLAQKNISAIIYKKNESIEGFIKNIIIQLIAFQSYEDLKLVFLLKREENMNLEYVRMLPHIWNKTKQVRFFTYDNNEMKDISKCLEIELENRLNNKDKDYKSFMPYYLIITNDYKKIENLKIITELLKIKKNVGFGILCIANDLLQLPNGCKTFINIDMQNKIGRIFENEISSTNQQQIILDNIENIYFDRLGQIISSIPMRNTETENFLLPTNYTFLEMYDVGKIEQLNILERWNKNDSTLSLKAPIGIDTSGMNILLDIHEKFHGPHGLIAGSTGSGKSEFIITYILSLAVNYHPDDVTFILIDYKGGGLAGAFQKGSVKLPHLVGTITNIDTNGLQRSLASIQSELRRRQIIFNEARNLTDGGTIDIYKYQKLYHDGTVHKPIPHLLIICDEFAELKQQQPEFMEELMSVSRIGRSLGVHLILATQKPAGIVNDQIRSNSRFAVCLKVQDKGDSMDVIKSPDAASLKSAGQFYLQVGNNEYFTLGQSGWAGAPYYPTDSIEKKADTSIQLISDIGITIKQVDDIMPKMLMNKGDQLTNIVKYIDSLAKQQKIKVNPLWLDNIPETIFIKDIKDKYKIKYENKEIKAIVGEYDDPDNQHQGVVELDFEKTGNIIIYGNAESGKETFLSTMIYDLITTYSSEQINMYILDFGSETLKIYKDCSQVGDVVFINNKEKIDRFITMIQFIFNKRKQELLDYNGDYNLYIKESGKNMPIIMIIINNWDIFAEMYGDNYEDAFQSLGRECTKCGIVLIVTVTSYTSMRYRLSQNFTQKIALQLNDENDYYNIFDKVGRKRPSHIFGRGLIEINEGKVYEFQTAKICEPEKYMQEIKDKIIEINQKYTRKVQPIPTLPSNVTHESLKRYLKGISQVPIGIVEKNLKVYDYNFKKNFTTLITSKNMEDAIQFTVNILEELNNLNDLKIVVFDAERVFTTKKLNLKEEYIKFASNIDNISKKHILCVILGIDKFLAECENVSTINFVTVMKQLEKNGNYSVIIVENANKMKSYEFEVWYKTYISRENGIWVGNGIDNQYLININSSRKELINNCGRSFGYVIKDGIAVLIKLLEMKEDDEDNE